MTTDSMCRASVVVKSEEHIELAIPGFGELTRSTSSKELFIETIVHSATDEKKHNYWRRYVK